MVCQCVTDVEKQVYGEHSGKTYRPAFLEGTDAGRVKPGALYTQFKKIKMATTQGLTAHAFHADYIHALKTRDAATASHFVSYFRPRLQSLLRKCGVPA